MADRAYIRKVRGVIREQGFFIQGVFPSHPTDPTYHYTVGLQRLPAPRPEVIVFGLDNHCASALLRAVYDRVRLRGALRAGEVVRGLSAAEPEWPIRADPVRPEWVEAYARMVAPVLNRRAEDVPMLQLVLCDEDGRWPEDPAVDPTLAHDQPLLAHDVPWRAPIVHTAEEDLFFVEQPEAVPVAVPVHAPFRPEGRFELLRAEVSELTRRIEALESITISGGRLNARLCLAFEPEIGEKDRQSSEDDCDADHGTYPPPHCKTSCRITPTVPAKEARKRECAQASERFLAKRVSAWQTRRGNSYAILKDRAGRRSAPRAHRVRPYNRTSCANCRSSSPCRLRS
jgi:hypothetical protein